MPLGNGRVSVNAWVDAASGDVMLSIGLADALDENSNLLKAGNTPNFPTLFLTIAVIF